MAHGGAVQGPHLLLRRSRLQEKAIKNQGEYRDWQGKELGIPRNYLIEFPLLASGLRSLCPFLQRKWGIERLNNGSATKSNLGLPQASFIHVALFMVIPR